MTIKKFSSKEEVLGAIKKAADHKRTLIEYLKKEYSVEELKKKDLKWQNSLDVIDLPIEQINALSLYKVHLKKNYYAITIHSL